MRNRMVEIQKELEQVLFKRANILDSVLPPLLFLVLFTVAGFNFAALSSLILAVVLAGLRLQRGQPLWYALGGAAGVGLAVLITRWLGDEQGFFLPAITSSAITLVLCGLSLVFRRPLVAWTSFIARRWPLDWYWHARIRPAYSEVTLLWTAYFAVRTLLQLNLFRQEATGGLALVNVIFGWPATILLLIISYLYGTWRLRRLGGPSVEEFSNSADPPWEGQQQGF